MGGKVTLKLGNLSTDKKNIQLNSTGKEIIGLEILIISKDIETEAFQFNEYRHDCSGFSWNSVFSEKYFQNFHF